MGARARGGGPDDETIIGARGRSSRWWPRTSATSGRRQVLNLGHTVGHAIEAATGYGATATARRSRSACSQRCGSRAATRCARRWQGLLAARGLPSRFDGAAVDDVSIEASRATRSARAAQVPFVLVEAPGEVTPGHDVAAATCAPRSRRSPGEHASIAVMHGVNLDQLGRRDPERYPAITLTELEVRVKRWAGELGLEASFFQTNSEGEFCEELHRRARPSTACLNPGAWTHYSWAIRDALEMAGLPAVEVHLSAVDEREEWRRCR